MHYGLFDDALFSNFYPLTYSKPFSQLRTGLFTQAEFASAVIHPVSLITSADHLNRYLSVSSSLHPESVSERVLWMNSRIRDYSELEPALKELKNPGDALSDGTTVFAILIGANQYAEFCTSNPEEFIKTTFTCKLETFDHTWEIILDNGKTQLTHWKVAEKSDRFTDLTELHKSSILGSGKVFAGKNVLIHPGVTFDLRNGNVILDDDSEVMAHSSFVGPVYIGKKSKIKIGAKIYQNTVIGPVCKVGGEVEDVIIQGYSNKQHDGFLGHAYLGEWCNLGADTNNSDLKNTYANVDIWENGKFADTGSQFMGLIMGDHSKTGINTQLNTGTVVGFSSNIFGAGFPERLIPSFHWSADGRLIDYRMNKAIETAKIVMSRRNISFTDADETLFHDIKTLAAIETPSVRKTK